jgi:DNA-binding FadR family transcriptional regulator
MTASGSRPEEIAQEIRKDIFRGRYRPGAREALKILAQQRLIEVRPGGSRVIPVHRASLEVLGHVLQMSGAPDPDLLAQLLDVHELLWAGAVRLAVERASDEELGRARELLATLSRERISEEEYLRTIAALLEIIAEASHNLVLRMVGNSLFTILGAVVPLLQRLRPSHATLLPAVRKVRRALARRDPVAAEQGIRALLRLKREYVLKKLGTPR